MSDEQMPVSVAQASFKVLGVDVKCHVLNNGQRIIEADSMQALLEAMGHPPPRDEPMDSMDEFTRWLRGAAS